MTEEIIQAYGVTIVKRTYAPLAELLPLIALGRKLIEEFEKDFRRKEKCRLR